MTGAGRHQWVVGAIGLLLVLIFSVSLYANGGGQGHPGLSAGSPLPHFVAPLATSTLNVPANVAPRCDPARPARRGLNVCGRQRIVLDLFSASAPSCVRSVDALQKVAAGFPQTSFAAVGIGATRRRIATLVRSHHWGIPVAYDSTAAVAQLYHVVVCPLIEVAGGNGRIRRLLIGDRWTAPTALARELRRVLREGA